MTSRVPISTIRSNIPIYLGDAAISELVQYCRSCQYARYLLVADRNTYAALGQRVEQGLKNQGWQVRTAILDGAKVVADEQRVFDVLFRADGEALVYLAVGSGTVTDITRYASFAARVPFISLPTAPSVDAYASGGAALVMGGFKLTVPAHAPAAIFADLETLCAAPQEMIAAGFGDVLGKYTSLADWKLGALLLDEAYDPEIAALGERALLETVANAAEIGRATDNGIVALTNALFESGLCMMAFGSSRPASGSEHLYSHFWEIQGMGQDQGTLLHGAKVGVGTVLAAQRYQAIRDLTRREALERLSGTSWPPQRDEVAQIRGTYGAVAERILDNHRPFMVMLDADRGRLRQKIAAHWTEVQAIAASVPPTHAIVDLLKQVGGPTDSQALSLSREQEEQAQRDARYLRSRFTVDTLGRLLGLW